jgi:hypothetical protein
MISPDIFSYIKSEENRYETEPQRLGDNWEWNMRDHIQLIFHLKHGIFYTGENNWTRVFKKIMLPLLRLSYWMEDIEVKDIVFYIESRGGRVLSFLLKKYHEEVYTKEHDLDTFLDDITESEVDYGGVLVQKTNLPRPEVMSLNTVAFCDQTDIMGGPIGFKHHFSPDGLRKMGKLGWGQESNGATITIEELIIMAGNQKDPVGMDDTDRNQSTGKAIEVYIVRGPLPEHYLEDNNNMEDWYNQVQIVAFYTDKDNKRHGVTLYRKKEEEGNLMFHQTEKVQGRGLGYSDGESLLGPQVWTNFLEIHKMNMMEAGSKVPLFTDDSTYQNRNKILDMENLEITTISEDSKFGIRQVPTAAPANLQLLSGAVDNIFDNAQLLGAAFDPVLGKEAVSGTTFRGQERTVAQGRGWHDRRKGQRAKFVEIIYRKMIIPQMVRDITSSDKKFLATLTPEELSWVSEQMATNYANARIKEKMFGAMEKGNEMPTREEQEVLKATFKKEFAKGGNKRLLGMLKDDFKGVEIKLGINIANKQKDLVNLSDKILSIFQFAIQNPDGLRQAMQVPALAQSFNDILEFGGLSQADFLTLTQPPEQQAPPLEISPEALNPLQAQPVTNEQG